MPDNVTQPLRLGLAEAITGLAMRSFHEGQVIQIDQFEIVMLPQDRFRFTAPGKAPETFRLKPAATLRPANELIADVAAFGAALVQTKGG